jgi:hypothetical protein
MNAATAYFRAFIGGGLDSFATHAVLIGVIATAEISLGIGIWLESPKDKGLREWVGLYTVLGGCVVSVIATVLLLIFDEGISRGQKDRIDAQQSTIIGLSKALAGRSIDEAAFVKVLSQATSKAPINLVYLRENGEVFSFALQIQRALIRSSWMVSEPKALSPKEMSDLYQDWPGQKAQVPRSGLSFILRLKVDKPTFDMLIPLMREPEVEALQQAFFVGLEEKLGTWSIPIWAASVWQPNAPAPGEIQIAVGPKQ